MDGPHVSLHRNSARG